MPHPAATRKSKAKSGRKGRPVAVRARRLSLRKGAIKVRVLSKGRGRPLLFLHGVNGLDGWPSWLDSLTDRFRVVAPEFPGFGESTGLEELDDFWDLALYHLELMEALGMRRPVVIGHWLGGAIATEVAALAPEAVSKLVLVAPTGVWNERDPGVDIFAMTEKDVTQASWHDAEAAARKGLIKAPQTDEEKKAAVLDRTKALAASGKYVWPIPDKGLKKRAYRIKAPTLLLFGASDKIVPPSYAPLFKKLIPGARVAKIPKAGHLPMLEQPQAVLKAVKAFLR